MAASASPRSVGRCADSAPGLPVLCALAAAGCAAAGVSVALALTSDHLTEPGLQAALLDWVMLPYIIGGLIAWWRRPDSRFGPLMVAAGFAMFASSLQWTSAAVPYTVGLAFDLLPPALFIHVFLAFPSGRLRRPAERVVVAAAYSAAIGPQLVKMALGGVAGDNLLADRRRARGRPHHPEGPADHAQRARSGCGGPPCRPQASRRPPAATLGCAAGRFLWARARDDRRPAAGRSVRAARVRDDPAGHLRGRRDRSGRVPDRTARREARPLLRRRALLSNWTLIRIHASSATPSLARLVIRR